MRKTAMPTLADIWPDQNQIKLFGPETPDNPDLDRKPIYAHGLHPHSVEHTCGHISDYVYRVPLNPADEGQLRKLGKEPCTACRALDARTMAQERKWPLLEGEPDKLDRAELARAKLMKEADAYMADVEMAMKLATVFPGGTVDPSVGAALLVPFRRAYQLLVRRNTPGWWIVRYKFSGRQLLQAFVEHLTRPAFAAFPERPKVPREILDDPRYVQWKNPNGAVDKAE
jgi:hypothetical protein